MQPSHRANKRPLLFAVTSAIGLALCTVFALAAPACAFAADKSFTVDGSMTITLQSAAAAQQASSSSLAKTGDVALYLFLGLLALAVAAFALVRASRKLSAATAGSKTGTYGTGSSQTKLFAAAAIAGLMAALCFGQFAANAAYASDKADGLTCTSKVVVNDKGEIVSSNLTVSNDASTAYTLTGIHAPEALSGWTASLPDKALDANSGYSTDWNAKKLSDDLLQQLKDSDGELTLTMQVTASRDPYTYTVSFDTGIDGVTVESQLVTEDGTAAQPTAVDAEDYQLAGWYTDKDCKQAFDFSTPITSDMTLYAKWAPKGYWLGTPCAEDPEASVTKTMSQIDADVAAIKNGDETVIAEYNGYLESDSMHLYTRWNGSTVDQSGEHEDNEYAEFRILQVGDHDDEGCSITFQAAHLLPSAYVMNDPGETGREYKDEESGETLYNYATNTGGWKASKLRAAMQEGGSIYENFDSAFTDKILAVQKGSSIGDCSSEASYSSNKLWIVSYSEINGINPTESFSCSEEGSQYTFYAKWIQGMRGNKCLNLHTRYGECYADGPEGDSTRWWLRSPMTNTEAGASWYGSFGITQSERGAAIFAQTSDTKLGVSPAFCF